MCRHDAIIKESELEEGKEISVFYTTCKTFQKKNSCAYPFDRESYLSLLEQSNLYKKIKITRLPPSQYYKYFD